MKIFRKIKFTHKKSSGSALVMVMIMIINAILIMTAITATSVRESKDSGFSKNSAIALQGADSGMEWILLKYNKNKKEEIKTLKDVFGLDNGKTVLEKKAKEDLGLNAEIDYKFYFFNQFRKFLKGSDKISDVHYITVIALLNKDEKNPVSRAFQAQVKSPEE